ncbi:MAG TPA: iron ABC transporter permease, partial [bacterium]|nr:iron ABC transporter permease [bacterium]
VQGRAGIHAFWSLDAAGSAEMLKLLPFCAVAVAASLFHRELDLMSLGEETAAARGVDPARVSLLLFALCSFAVAGVVAVTGPIGFIGLMAPHIARLIVGPAHRFLGPATLFTGAALLTLCDTAARTLIAPAEIPVGVLTALLGGPFFLWLLLRRTQH